MCVVFCHSIQCISKFNMQTWNTFSLSSKSFMIISFTIARIGVPIFLCLTGTLTLRKNFEVTNIFCKKINNRKCS